MAKSNDLNPIVMEGQIRRDTIPYVAKDTISWKVVSHDSVSKAEYSTATRANLHEGLPIPVNQLHTDWITSLLILAAILYLVVITFSRNLFSDIARVFSLAPRTRHIIDSRSIFHWQSTLANLASFINISIFLYLLIRGTGISLPGVLNGPLLWVALLLSVSLAISVRHITTFMTGNISGHSRIFAEYLNNIYSLYRLMGISLIPIIISISYFPFITPLFLFKTGVAIIVFVFIVRIISLLIIFIRSNVSIFYFLLYLCALEILPVAIIFRIMTT